MRYLLAAALACAIGAPAALALPAASLQSAALTQSSPILQVAKRQKAQTAKRSRKNDPNAIHPLVGSGDY